MRPVFYQVSLTAETEEQARADAIEQHQDGMSVEVDNGSPEIESIERVKKT